VKIADFGLGQRSDSRSGTTSPFGTDGYIDPVAQIAKTFTPASDIFSLGITMIEVLTGSRDLRNSIPGPPEFQALIRSMTAFDPFAKTFNVDCRPTARQLGGFPNPADRPDTQDWTPTPNGNVRFPRSLQTR
jgi:serine/threonine protein kinase